VLRCNYYYLKVRPGATELKMDLTSKFKTGKQLSGSTCCTLHHTGSTKLPFLSFFHFTAPNRIFVLFIVKSVGQNLYLLRYNIKEN